ncbi:recombinase family protein [Nocardioides rubriscoriae]|uniref:recombinase family protein n=1 Tax=Nocardioides rubriscoriae TaxID=642762 RepID=UPI0011DF73AF|nr:recombinase family protein [Nocardioides rubriscoriae]
MRLIGYLRVSSESQLDGFGLVTQERAIRSWINSGDHKLIDLVSDAGVSGATEALDRPGLTEALHAVLTGTVDGIVIARLDRLARSLSVQEATLAMIWQADGNVFTVDQGMVLKDDVDDPLRTALRQVVGVFSELERRLVTKRLKDGRDAKAATGRKSTGSYAYGYTGAGRGRSRDAAPVRDEQLVIQTIVQSRAEGMSYREIAAELDARGLRPRRASSWSPMTVRSVVLRAQADGAPGSQLRDSAL